MLTEGKMKIVLLVVTVLTIVSSMFANFSVGSSLGQGELVCLVWVCVFCISCVCALMEG